MNNTGPRILIIDDERAIRRFLSTTLQAHHFRTVEAADGREGLLALAEVRPDLVILDLGLPDMDGLEVLKRLREWSDVPVIILSVRNQEADKIAGLEAGADDYLTKPFSMGELVARLRAALRRVCHPVSEPVVHAGSLTIDMNQRLVTRGEEAVNLTPTEYDILRTLATQEGKVLTHQQLLHEVWGEGHNKDAHVLRVNISNLRRKLEPEPAHPHFIVTEPGVGYRFRGEH